MNKLEIKQQIFNKLYELYVPEEQFTEESALKLITEYSALKGVNICSKSLNGHRHSLMGSLKTFNMLNDLNIWGPIYKNFVKSLAKYIGDRKVLEVCCGNGWLSTGLMFYGVDIMPTDNFSWILSNRYKVNAYIKNMEAEEARYVWDYVIDEIQQYDIKDEGFFWGIINSNLEYIVKVDENYFEGIEVDCEWSDYDKYFMNHIWKAFVEQLKQELEAEL